MKFWIDECLTPALVGRAHFHGYEATCTRDRGYLGMRDDELLTLAVTEEFVFVTNNHADFMGLCANAELHTGLVVLPQRPRDAQLPLFSDAITHIERERHVLHALVQDPFPWTVAELARDMGREGRWTEDAVAALDAAGLVHRFVVLRPTGEDQPEERVEVVIPTRAARRLDELQGGPL